MEISIYWTEFSETELRDIFEKSDHRSLNNYIEMVLRRDVGNIPNTTTMEAIEEAKEPSQLERIALPSHKLV